MKEAWSCPSACAKDANNISELLMSQDKKQMMRNLYCDEKYNNGQASDYEMFAEWEQILPCCVGSGSAAFYEAELKFLEISPWKCDGKRKTPYDLWNEGNERISRINLSKYDIKTMKNIENQRFNINKIISNLTNKNKNKEVSYEQWIQESLEAVQKVESDGLHLLLSAEGDGLTRPDPYHASLIFQRLLCGEKINASEELLLAMQWLIEAFLRQKKEGRKMILHLNASSYCLASSIVGFFKEKGLFAGEIRVAIRLWDPVKEWLPLMNLGDRDLQIYPELILHPSDFAFPLEDGLKKIAAEYPLGGLRFGGMMTDAPLYFLGCDRFEQALRTYISSGLNCDEKVNEIIDYILNN